MSQPAPTIEAVYAAALAARGFVSDPAQLRAVQVLQRCMDDWVAYKKLRSSTFKKLIHRPVLPRGVYLYGGVGRGKSFLLDCFFNAVPLKRKVRLHFHEFMREVHAQLFELQGTVNPLDKLAQRIARRYKLICFDEFHIADITDAMILHRLLVGLFENGVGFVATSNFHPDQLYPDGLHRDRILPAIALLKQKLEVLNVDAGTDYRWRALTQLQFYHTPLGASAEVRMQQAFERLAQSADEEPQLHIAGRSIVARRRCGSLIWFDFAALCATARSQNDYLEIATRFDTVLLSNVPAMSPAQAAAARRFTLLVDVLYDRHVKLIVSAAVPAPELYPEGPLAHEFVRTVSRLQEMQGSEFLALKRRLVDTGLT